MNPTLESTGYVGVFDSGVGGLTVVRKMLDLLPDQQIVFVADQAHVPYGGRHLSEVCSFAESISGELIRGGASAVVMACNISTATALQHVSSINPNQVVVGVIGPGSMAAAASTRSGSIGVLATEGTVKTRAYSRALHELNPDFEVAEVACPLFVPLIEAGETSSPAAYAAAVQYLAPIVEARADTVILGCTHYPFLLPCLESVCPDVMFIDPAVQTVQSLRSELTSRNHRCAKVSGRTSAKHRLYTTGNCEQFAVQVELFLPGCSSLFQIHHADWQDGHLIIHVDA